MKKKIFIIMAFLFFIIMSIVNFKVNAEGEVFISEYVQDFKYESGGKVEEGIYDIDLETTDDLVLESLKDDDGSDYLRYTLNTISSTINFRNSSSLDSGLWNKPNTNAMISIRFRTNALNTNKYIKMYMPKSISTNSVDNDFSINLLNIHTGETDLSYNSGLGTTIINDSSSYLYVSEWNRLDVTIESSANTIDSQDYIHAYLNGYYLYSSRMDIMTSSVNEDISWNGNIFDINISTASTSVVDEIIDIDYIKITEKYDEYVQDFKYINDNAVGKKQYDIADLISMPSLFVNKDVDDTDYLRFTLSNVINEEGYSFKNTLYENKGLWNKNNKNAIISMRFRTDSLNTQKSIKMKFTTEACNINLDTVLLNVRNGILTYDTGLELKNINNSSGLIEINKWQQLDVVIESAANRNDSKDYIHVYLNGYHLYSDQLGVSGWNGNLYDLSIYKDDSPASVETFDIDFIKINTYKAVKTGNISDFNVDEDCIFTLTDKLLNVNVDASMPIYSVDLQSDTILVYDNKENTFKAPETLIDVTEEITINYIGGYSITFNVTIKHTHTEELVLGTEASCENTGLTEGSYCLECNQVLVEQVEIPALGHEYGQVEYTWNLNNTECSAIRICNNDNLHIEEEDAIITSETIDATCEEDGKITYTAEFINAAFATQIKEVEIDAFGHNYGTKWNYMDATGHAHKCSNIGCDNHDEIVEHTSSGPATIDNPEICIVCEYVINQALGHMHEYNSKIENENTLKTAAGCETNEVYYYSCSCGDISSDLTYEKDNTQKGHAYGAINYKWNNDNSLCVASRVCSNDENHIEEENATIITTVIPAKCEVAGKIVYSATFTNPAFTIQNKEEKIEALIHVYSLIWDYKDSTGHAHKCSNIGCSSHDEIVEHISSGAATEESAEMCIVCNYEISPKLEHVHNHNIKTENENTLKSEADCENNTKYYYSCSCGDVSNELYYEIENSSLGHIEEKLLKIYPTLTSTGLTEGKKCSICNTILVKQEEIPVLVIEDINVDTIYSFNSGDTAKENYYVLNSQCNTENATLLFNNMYVDALNGKLSDNGGTWFQFNENTEIRFKVAKAASIKLVMYNSSTEYTVNGVLANADHVYSVAAGEVSIISNSDGYIGYINITFPVELPENDEYVYKWDFDGSDVKYSNQFSYKESIQQATSTFNGLSIDASIGKLEYNSDGYTQFNKDTIIKFSVDTNIVLTIISYPGQYKYNVNDIASTNDITTIEIKAGNVIIKATGTAYILSISYQIFDGCIHNEVVDEEIKPTCENEGLTQGSHCSICDEVIINQEKIPSLGHKYGDVIYTWKSNNTICEAERICENDKEHKETQRAVITSDIIPAKCKEEGKIIYTAEFTNEAFTTQIKEVIIDALGHSYGANWDYKDASGHAHKCSNTGCDSHDEIVEHTSGGVVTIDNPEICIICNFVINQALGHKHDYSLKIENQDTLKKSSDCETNAEYYYSCSCGDISNELSYIKENSATGHDYKEVEYTWNNDYTACVAIRECKNNSSHIEEENAVVTSETIAAKCKEEGKIIYTAEFTNEGFTTQIKEVIIDALGHSYGANWDYKDASGHAHKCSNTGCDSHDEIVEHTSGGAATIDNPEICIICNFVINQALGHKHDYSLKIENQDTLKKSSDCETNAEYYYSCSCGDISNELSYIKENSATGHDYKEVEYTWNNDYTACVAIRECKNNSSHIEEENAIVTSETIAAKCKEEGKIIYTAEFTNEAFTTQIKEVIIDTLGHSYDNACDEECNICNDKREVQHIDNNNDCICDECNKKLPNNNNSYNRYVLSISIRVMGIMAILGTALFIYKRKKII